MGSNMFINSANVSILGRGKNSQILTMMFQFQKNINAYKELFKALENEKFQSELLNEIQSYVLKNEGASNSINKLSVNW